MRASLPLLTIILLACMAIATGSSAQQFMDNKGFFVRKGCKYKPGKAIIDTVATLDPTTGAEVFEAREDTSYPRHINGKRVYDIDEVTTPVQFGDEDISPDAYLIGQLKNTLMATMFHEFAAAMLLNLRAVIVDENGKIVFYEFYGVKGITAENRIKPLHFAKLPENINKIMSELPPLKPATLNGQNVMAYAGIDLHHYKIERSGGDITYDYDGSILGE